MNFPSPFVSAASSEVSFQVVLETGPRKCARDPRMPPDPRPWRGRRVLLVLSFRVGLSVSAPGQAGKV